MKIKEGFVLREVAGDTVVIPTGGDLDMNMMITLNESGAFLWKRLEQEISREDLIAAVLKEYPDVDQATAEMAVDGFVAKLKENEFLN